MFRWLKKKSVPAVRSMPVREPAEEQGPQTMADLLSDRRKLAEWVEEFMILGRPWEENYALSPDEDAQRELEITFEQKERLAKEFHVLRISGVLIFMRQRYDDGKYEAFLNDIARRLARALSLDLNTVGQALNDYVRFSLDGETNKVESMYMTRMYDDNPHYLRMKLSGIGTIAVGQIETSFNIFRDAIQGKLAGQ